MRASLVAGALLLTACAPQAYRLTRSGDRDLLLPPGVKAAPPAGPSADCAASGLTPRTSHYSAYGCYVRSGFVDLQPGMRMRIVKPVMANGGEALKAETVSQEGLNLTVRTNAVGVDTRFVGYEELPAAVGFAAGTSHYRLFFLARDLGRERKITLIGGTSVKDLDEATENLERYCAIAGAACLAVTPGMVIGPEIAVTVRGAKTYLPLGASLREAVNGADPARVKLHRIWRGKLTPVMAVAPNAPPLLPLPLNGGDAIVY